MKLTKLTGSSWDHPRGHAPMVATAAHYRDVRGGTVAIDWVPRTLKEFGTVSVAALAHEFDLIVIDHPHIGTMAESGCVIPLDDLIDGADLDFLARASPGRSHQSYQYGGHQWALAVDVACQTSAWRPDLLERQPATWEEVVRLAQDGGQCATSDDRLVDRDVALWGLETMRRVAAPSDPCCLSYNPINVLDALAGSSKYVYSPLVFCYVSYSRAGHPGARITFGDMPVMSAGDAPSGSLLGGAGLAVSAYGGARQEALDYCLFVASTDEQCGTYFASGGQPAHPQAWLSPELDRESGGFFSGVGFTMRGAWTRPTGPNFAEFQNAMVDLFGGWYDEGSASESFLDRLDALYRGWARTGKVAQ